MLEQLRNLWMVLPNDTKLISFGYIMLALAIGGIYCTSWQKNVRRNETLNPNDPQPYQNFDLNSAQARDYLYANKTLRYPSHQTMAHRPMSIDDWLEITSDYSKELEDRRRIIGEQGHHVLQSLPENDLASQELLLTILDWLPKRYPKHFNLTRTANAIRFSNNITDQVWEWPNAFNAPLGSEALLIVSRLVQCDFLIAKEREDGHIYCVGGLVVYPGSYLLSEVVGKRIEEIHQVIPHSDRIVPSIQRSLKRLEPDKPFERSSWFITDDNNKFWHHIANLTANEVVTVAPQDLYLRIDHQTFRKLPSSRAIIFGIHPHIRQLNTMVNSPLIPALLFKIHTDSCPDLLTYKGTSKYWGALKVWLQSAAEEQLQKGLVQPQDKVEGFRRYDKRAEVTEWLCPRLGDFGAGMQVPLSLSDSKPAAEFDPHSSQIRRVTFTASIGFTIATNNSAMSQSKVNVASGVLPEAEIVDKTLPHTHPLDPLSPHEIVQVSLAVQRHVTSQNLGIKAIKFVTSSIISPPKKDVLAYLGIPTEPGQAVKPSGADLPRRAETDVIDPVSGNNYNITLTLDKATQQWAVDTLTQLPDGTQPQITVEELADCENIIRADPQVIKLAAEVGISPEQISADGWSIGWDARYPEKQRIQQALLYARFGKHDNLYAHPMDFMPVIDVNERKVIHIDFPPHRAVNGQELSASTIPPPLNEDPLSRSGRQRIPPPLTPHEYLPDLVTPKPENKQRNTLKPLHVVQPEGVSFKMTDTNVLEWAGWKMHIGFSVREGIALSTITHQDGDEIRPVLYRLSLAEMVVPYAAPEHPHPRKFAFDVGEYGMGTQANELTLGCDCLGTIHYLPGAFVGHDGKPVVLKHAICIHEEDAGTLWKHTDYRVGGRAHAVRSRKLVVSMVCTLANYEYTFAYQFYLDGTIELETRLSGILNVYVLAQGESASPFGTQVAPQINAQYHQHIFSLRIDPMIDGIHNTVVESDLSSIAHPAGSAENFAGNGFISTDKRITRLHEGVREYNSEADRRWRIVNPNRKHYSSGKEVAYSIMAKGAFDSLRAIEGSWARERAAFAGKALWVVKDVEGSSGSERMWPAGKYVPQTRGNPSDSVLSWTTGKDDNLENEDLVLFLTFGLTHIPRPEDWPVMPVEHIRVAFKPNGFFKQNPALYLDAAHDTKSMKAFPEGGVNRTNGTVEESHTHNNCCQ